MRLWTEGPAWVCGLDLFVGLLILRTIPSASAANIAEHIAAGIGVQSSSDNFSTTAVLTSVTSTPKLGWNSSVFSAATTTGAAGISNESGATVGSLTISSVDTDYVPSDTFSTSVVLTSVTSTPGLARNSSVFSAATTTGAAGISNETGAAVGSLTISSVGTDHVRSNASANMTGDCWDQWNSFWTANQSATMLTQIIATTTQTLVRTPTYYSSSDIVIGATTWTTFYTQYADAAHNFPISTQTTLDSAAGSLTAITEIPTSTGEPITRLTTVEYQKNVPAFDLTVTTPACVLPSIVPQCQSQWDAWVRGGAANSLPLCQAASIDSAQCSSVISAQYAGYRVFGDTGIDAWVTSGTSTWWPATQTYAPGCSLGCQTCAITGDTVQVYYWPPTTATAFENGTLTATRSALLSTGVVNASVPVTAVVGNVTLTSPTIYISYRSLYASNSCEQVGKRYSNTIIPLANNNELSSLAYHQLDDMPMQPGLSGSGVSWKYDQMPFNLSDLTEPVPESIFDQLPQCKLSLQAWTSAGFDTQSFTCSHAAAYNPIIAIPPEVRNLDPEWASCTAWYGGAYDPPKALQAAAAIATPTVPAVADTTAASAASTATDGLPSKTGQAQAADTGSNDPAETSGGGDDATGQNDSGAPGQTQDASKDSESTVLQANPSPTVADTTAASAASTATDGLPSKTGQAQAADTGSDDPAETSDSGDDATGQNDSGAPGQTQDASKDNESTVSQANPSPTAADPAQSGAEGPSAVESKTEATQKTQSSPAANTPADLGSASGQLVDNTAEQIEPTNVLSTTAVDPNIAANPTAPSQATTNALSILQSALTSQASAADASDAPISLSSAFDQPAASDPHPGTGVAPAQTIQTEGSGNALTVASAQGGSNEGSGNALTVASAQGGSNQGSGVVSVAHSQDPGTAVPEADTAGRQSTGNVQAGATETGASGASPIPTGTAVSIGSQVYTVAAVTEDANAVVVANGGSSATLQVGSAVVSIGDQPVSAAQGGEVIVGSGDSAATLTVPQTQPSASQGPQKTVLTLDSQVVTAVVTSGGVVLQNGRTAATISAGQAQASFGNQVVSVDDGNRLIAGSSTYDLPTPKDTSGARTVFSIAGQAYTASAVDSASGAIEVAGQTLTAGGSVQTIGDHIVSAGSSYVLLDGSSTIPILRPTSAPTPPSRTTLITVGGSLFTVSAIPGKPSEVALNQFTLTAGGDQVNINGYVVTQGPAGLVVDGNTTLQFQSGGWTTATESDTDASSVTTLPEALTADASGVVLTVASSRVTAIPVPDQSNAVVVDGVTLSEGGAAHTINGQVVSEGPDGLVVGGSTTVVVSDSTTTPRPTRSGSDSPFIPKETLSSMTSGAAALGRMSGWATVLGLGFALMYV